MKKLTSLLLASALVVAPIATSFAYQQTDIDLKMRLASEMHVGCRIG